MGLSRLLNRTFGTNVFSAPPAIEAGGAEGVSVLLSFNDSSLVFLTNRLK